MTPKPLRERVEPCPRCPFVVGAPEDIMDEVERRIDDGEAWVCHMSCDGPRVTARSLLCAGAERAAREASV